MNEINYLDVVSYIEEKSGYKLIPEQVEVVKEIVDLTIKKQLIACGRGFSKSFLCAGVSLYLIDKFSSKIGEPVTVLLVSHQQEIYVKLDQFFENDESLTERLRVKGERFHYPMDELQFKDNRSRIILRMDTSRMVRGNRANFVFIDECQSVPKEVVVKDAMPTLTGSNSKFIAVGTPSEKSWFVETLEKANKNRSKKSHEWHVSHFSSEVCFWLKDQLSMWREEMNAEEYTSEILAEIPDDEYLSPFKKLLKKAVQDVPIEALGGVGSYAVGGLDLAFGNTCKTALTVLEKNRKSKKAKVLFSEAFTPNMQKIIEIVNNWKLNVLKIDSRPKELSDRIKLEVEPFCKKTKFVYVNATGQKGQMIAQLMLLMESNLTIPSTFNPLIKELEKYYQSKDRGKDLADALILAAFESVDTQPSLASHSMVIFNEMAKENEMILRSGRIVRW